MAKAKTPRPVKRAPAARAASEQQRIDQALKQASKHAKQSLALEGLQLTTQSWHGTSIRHPAV
jgi:hypothetical protein